MGQSEEKLRMKVSNLRSEVIAGRRRIAYLESQIKEPEAHQKHVEDLYNAVREAYYCILKDEGAWKHEGNGDACLAILANLVPDHYFEGVRRRAESTRFPIHEAVGDTP